MRAIKPLLIAGIGAAALVGVAAVAASAPQGHVLTVRLPNGAVEQIRYFGDTPPKVVVMRAPMAAGAFGPVAMFGPNSPFAQMDRIQAQINRRMAAVMAQAYAMQASALAGAAAPGLQQTVVGQLPGGGQSLSTISTFSGGHACMRGVQIIGQGAGKAPQVISKASGDCGPGAATPGVGIADRPSAPAAASHTIAVKATPKPTHPTGGTTI